MADFITPPTPPVGRASDNETGLRNPAPLQRGQRVTGLNRVGRNTAAATIGKVVTMILGFAVTPMLLARLGSTQFGLYAILISLQSYFGLFDLGIGSGLARFMITHDATGDQEGVRRITSFGLLYYAILSIILFPAVYFLAPLGVHWLRVPAVLVRSGIISIYYLFALFMISSAMGVIGARLYAIHRMDLSALSSVISNAFFVAAILLVVPRFPTLLVALACSAVPVAVGTIINLFLLYKLGHKRLLSNPFRLSKSSMSSLFTFGAWSQINSITSVINLEADKLVIGKMLGAGTVAPYQVGNRYALLSRALPLTLLGALYPDVTARLAKGLEGADFERFYRESLRALMLATLTIVGFLIAVSPPLLRAWIGHPVAGANAIAVALLVSYAINNLTGIGTTVVRAQGHPEIETYYAVASAVLNVGATIALTPHYGLWGVVGGTIIGNVIGSLGFIGLFHARSHLPIGRTLMIWLIPLVFGVFLAAIATYLVNKGLSQILIPGGRWAHIAVIAMTGAFYLAILFVVLTVLRFWTDDDIAAAQKVRNRLLMTKS